MKIQRFAIALTLLNLALLIFLVAQGRRVEAQSVATVLRGRALEIVDEQGRVRAEIKVLPAQPTLKMPDGTTGYPAAVQFRLITSQGRPNAKVVATEDGSGLLLGGESDPANRTDSRPGHEPFRKACQQRWAAAGRQALAPPESPSPLSLSSQTDATSYAVENRCKSKEFATTLGLHFGHLDGYLDTLFTRSRCGYFACANKPRFSSPIATTVYHRLPG